MNAYDYTVITTDKKKIQGLLWADSEDEVRTKLKLEGYVICGIVKSSSKSVRWSHKQVSATSYQLGLLLQSGISLRRSLELLMEGSNTMLYRSLYEGIQRGQSLSEVLRQKSFPPIALALLESGEMSGNVGESLQYIASYYERERKYQQKILSAISYPLFLLILMNIFFLVTILFIIPSFSRVFVTMHIELPWMTKGLFVLGNSIREHPFIYIGIHTGIIGILIYACRQSAIKYRFDRQLWLLAQHNMFLTSLYYTNILHIWALLLDSGISIINTIHITKHIWRNQYGETCSCHVYDMLCKGHSFSESLKTASIGNPFIWQMISVGEESGELVAMLNHCSDYYESLLTQYIARMERLMEPILLTIMGVGIAILVISVMYPLFTSISSLSGQ